MRSTRSGRRRPPASAALLVGLAAVQPFVAFAERNRSQITQPLRLVAYVIAVVAVWELILVLVGRVWSRAAGERIGVVVATAVVCFFGYSMVFDTNPRDTTRLLVVLLVWLVLTGALLRLASLVGGNEHVRFGLLVFAAVMTAAPALALVAGGGEQEPIVAVTEPGDLPTPATGTPNVYWIVLDAHARPDVLEEVVGLDVSAFVGDLERRGFAVSSSSLASYPRTHLSLSSTLQMDYVIEPGHDVEDEFARFGPVVLGRSNVTARFAALGYENVYGPAGGLEWSRCRPELVDVCLDPIRPSPSTGELERALLDLTPLGAVPLPVAYTDPVHMARELERAGVHRSPPFFVLQHVMAPHDPYRYREDCSARTVPVNRHSLSVAEQMIEYATQVRCLDELVVEAVDEIVARDPTAIVIVQSDHGSDFSFSWKGSPDEWTDAQLVERYGVLNAMRLPAGCEGDVERLALVNTFRVVFACIEGREPELLEHRAFLQPLDDLGALTEVDPDRLRT